MAVKESRFAIEAGMAALKWLVEGYGYDITSSDVLDAYKHTMDGSRHSGCESEILERIRSLLEKEAYENGFVKKILGPELGISSTAKKD